MARPVRSRWFVVVMAVGALGSALLMALLIVFVAPSAPGEPLVTRELTSGQDFELTFAATGQPLRVFVDMECEACSLPVEGRIEVWAAERRLKQVEISAGTREAFASRNRLVEQYITEIPALVAPAPVSVRGRLSVSAERGVLSGAPGPEAPPAVVRRLRVTIAP